MPMRWASAWLRRRTSVFRRSRVAAVGLALVSSATAVIPAAARPDKAVLSHRLIVAVEKTLAPAAEKKLAVLVLVGQSAGAPAGAVATASKPLTVHLDNRGLYRVRAEIDVSCTGGCEASYRISGSANHKLRVVPSCRPHGSGFACSKVKILRVY